MNQEEHNLAGVSNEDVDATLPHLTDTEIAEHLFILGQQFRNSSDGYAIGGVLIEAARRLSEEYEEVSAEELGEEQDEERDNE